MNEEYEILGEKWKIVKKKFKENQKYIHVHTVNNFLTRVNKIQSASDRQQVYNLLQEYFDVLLDGSSDLERESHILFGKYLRPIAVLYERDFGFIPNVNVEVLLFWYSIVIVILYFLNSGFLNYVIFGIPFIAYQTYLSSKKRNQKVYGYLW